MICSDPSSLCWQIKRSKTIRIQIPMLLLKMNIKMPWLHTEEFSLQQRGVDTLSSKDLRQQSTATMWAHIPMTPWHSMTVDYIILTTIDYGDMMTLIVITLLCLGGISIWAADSSHAANHAAGACYQVKQNLLEACVVQSQQSDYSQVRSQVAVLLHQTSRKDLGFIPWSRAISSFVIRRLRDVIQGPWPWHWEEFKHGDLLAMVLQKPLP